MLDAAIVGLGWWGRTLVRAVQGRSTSLRFVAGATRRRETAEAFAQEYGFHLHDSFEDVLADTSVAAVVLATPHLDHERQIIAAARAGKHVFVEKPFTLDRASAERAVNAVREAGVTVALGHNRRFHPNMADLRARLARGALGTLLHVEATMTSPSGLFMASGNWRADPEQSPVGGMAPLGIHMVDAMIDLVGPVTDVIAQTTHRAAATGVLDTTGVLLRFDNGVTGYLSCMIATAPSYRLCLYGSAGIAEIRGPKLDELVFRACPDSPNAAGVAAPPPEHVDRPGVDTVALELDAFADAVSGDRPYPITQEQMVHGAAVYEAIAASAPQRQVVAVSK